MIKPTVGRQVWFYPSKGDVDVERWDAGQPCAATIVFVHSDTVVNLLVLDHVGRAHMKSYVTLLQGDAVGGEVEYAAWMPYQKAVASGQQAPTVHAA